MKFCLIIKGPIRPNKDIVIDNIQLLSSCFLGHNYDIIFSTWENDIINACEIINIIKPKYSIILKSPELNYIFKENSFNTKNCFNQFYMVNKNIDFAISLNCYDYLVLTRTDLKMMIDLNKWVKNDSYTTVHSKQCGQPFTNDQFGIAPPNIMKLFWKYNNDLELCRLIDSSNYPEQIIDINIDAANIKVLQEEFKLWEIKR